MPTAGHVEQPSARDVLVSADQAPLARILDSRAGLDGTRDELTGYAHPETDGYYFVPAVTALRAFATEIEAG